MAEIIFSALQIKKILYKHLKYRRGIDGIIEMNFQDDGYGDFEMVVKTKEEKPCDACVEE